MLKGSECRKFIISKDGELRIGGFCERETYLHKELLYGDKICYGGGYAYVFPEEKKLILFDKSMDFGRPQFDKFTYFEGSKDWTIVYRCDLSDEESEITIDLTNIECWD